MHAPRSQSLGHPLHTTVLFHTTAQSIPFPVESGQWRWRRAWGLGSSQRIHTRSSFQSSGLTNRLHLLAGHRTGQLLAVHWPLLRIILFYTACEWIIHQSRAGPFHTWILGLWSFLVPSRSSHGKQSLDGASLLPSQPRQWSSLSTPQMGQKKLLGTQCKVVSVLILTF